MRIIKYPKPETFEELSRRPELDRGQLEVTVVTILEMVRSEGDIALKRYSKEFDQVEIDHFQVSQREFQQATRNISTELKAAIKVAKNNIEKFHRSQTQPHKIIETMPGVSCWQRRTAIEKVGLYVPGGSAPLFSTLLMLGIPARLAGCEEIVVCTPPTKHGTIDDTILYVAKELGIQKVYKTGGAQAIAAMTFGTETVPRVYKIFGPGNQYVTVAKQLAQMEGVAIDMPAGPSEVAIVADHDANPAFIAADLLSQAEHGPDSQVLLVTTEEYLIDKVQSALEQQLKTLPRRELAEKSLANSQLVLVDNMKMAMNLINIYAPEHLILMVSNPHKLATEVKNAGSVFLGLYTPESAGDYASGTNHTLPTNHYARMYSGVSLDSFLKSITFQDISKQGLETLGPTIQKMAESENLTAHSQAVAVRLSQIREQK